MGGLKTRENHDDAAILAPRKANCRGAKRSFARIAESLGKSAKGCVGREKKDTGGGNLICILS
jgi:hypothetical protein